MRGIITYTIFHFIAKEVQLIKQVKVASWKAKAPFGFTGTGWNADQSGWIGKPWNESSPT